MDFDTLNLINILLSRGIIFVTDAMVMSDSTQRQVMYRLDKINDFLSHNDYPIIEIGKNKEFIMNNASSSFLFDYLYDQEANMTYYMNSEERRKYIYLLLFINQENVTMQALIDILQVSKSTTLQDLKELSEKLQIEGLSIENDRNRGYYISGHERIIRKYMMNIILDFVGIDHNFRVLNILFDNHYLMDVKEVRETVERLAKKYEIIFVEDRLLEFLYVFIMTKYRMLSNTKQYDIYNDIPQIELMNTFKEYDFTKELLEIYLGEDSTNYEEDLQYLTSWILGVSVGDVLESSADLLFISEIVWKIIRRFEMVSGIMFDDRETIFRHIFSHFRPAYYRLLFKHPIKNPLSTKVRSEYGDLYQLVYETLRPLSALLESEIPEEEIAYLTLHFHSVYNELKIKKKDRFKGLIICLNGVGSSVILYNELRNMFDDIDFYKPVEASKFDIKAYQPDIIFTTHYIKKIRKLDVPIIKVSPVMDTVSRNLVDQEVRKELGLTMPEHQYIDGILNVVKTHFGFIDNEQRFVADILNVFNVSKSDPVEEYNTNLRLIDMISLDCITLQIDTHNWDDAVRIVGQSLIDTKAVTPRYVESILKKHHSEIYDFVIVPKVAMPHASADNGALKHAFSIGVLKEPLFLDENNDRSVKYIFFLSSPDNVNHINAMAEFLHLLNDKYFYKCLDNAKSPNEVYDYFLNNSK